jgi:hypothetical protein
MMESISRLVSESFARHGFERPLDYRRLRWSRWFRCESHHSLLLVPSKPGIFALAEEMAHIGTDAEARPEPSPREAEALLHPEHSECAGTLSRRMLVVSQFFEDDDMAFVLDRMLSRQNPLRARLVSGCYFVRFVVIEDRCQRRSICNALNQWIVSAAEKASGIGSHFASSLELTPENLAADSACRETAQKGADAASPERNPREAATFLRPERSECAPHPLKVASSHFSAATPHLDSGAAANRHCPTPFPSGF